MQIPVLIMLHDSVSVKIKTNMKFQYFGQYKDQNQIALYFNQYDCITYLTVPLILNTADENVLTQLTLTFDKEV